jgi:hypothetical protein
MTHSGHPEESAETADRCEECESIQRQLQDVESKSIEHENNGRDVIQITDFGLRLDAIEKREQRRQELVELREDAMQRQVEHLINKHRP